MRRVAWGGMGGVFALGACVFAPDFSRYPSCDTAGACPSGFTCLVPEGLCLPDCGERGPCAPLEETPAPPDAGPGAPDAGTPDAGTPDAGQPERPPSLELVATLPPDGVEREGFTFAFQARGGTPPLTFSLAGDAPPGLGLDAQGTLSGTPTTPGEYTFTLEARDAAAEPQRVSQSVTVRIHPELRLAGPLILADFPRGGVYAERVLALGGRPPYTFTLPAGNPLPSGLALYEEGAVRGTSNSAGASSFEVRVTDSARPPRITSGSLQLTASSCATPPCMRTRTLPDARVGDAYTYALQATTGTSSPTWSVTVGAPPPGLQLTSDGVLSGTPLQSGRFEATYCVSEWLGTVLGTRSVTLSLKVL
ncbi:Ig domain-containing protein [Archangium primigenium]|uniref:Ig domain-containing protein n=1 Tax=[Archangium] primigenium TaxID=2792470 RepID=UPI00195EA736|nr:Ig domain-containing protein [Archangium primigenium]MBM7111962.1 putative Ig domain-containing protein [Archangium primigenium]